MSRTSSIPIDSDAARRAAGELAEFIADPHEGTPIDPSSNDRVEPPALGWFNASRVMVAVPLFNAQLDAERIIDDIVVFARSVPAWEFVFIDDGSTDDTVAAFQKRLAAVGFVDPGTAARLSVIPSSPHAGLGHVTRIAGLECDAEHLIVLLPAFNGDWSVLAGVRDTLQASPMVLAPALVQPGLAIRLARAVAARSLGLEPMAAPQALGILGPLAKVLAERTSLRGPGFDLELRHLALRLGQRTQACPTLPARTGHGVASTNPGHWLGQVGATLLAPIAIGLRSLLGGYRLKAAHAASTPPASSARSSGVFRRKAS
ncbi:MAG: hypothetical protein K2Y21_11275 [Phycisphaerales bacterium]|nr:hypothetical protein [Phycisphaerales bacterium]